MQKNLYPGPGAGSKTIADSDLFGWLGPYPASPGHRRGPGSDMAAAAAVSIAGHANALQQAALAVIAEIGPCSADQVASRLRRSPLAIRSSLSELAKLGKITRAEGRAVNESGLPASLWKITGEAAA